MDIFISASMISFAETDVAISCNIVWNCTHARRHTYICANMHTPTQYWHARRLHCSHTQTHIRFKYSFRRRLIARTTISLVATFNSLLQWAAGDHFSVLHQCILLVHHRKAPILPTYYTNPLNKISHFHSGNRMHALRPTKINIHPDHFYI